MLDLIELSIESSFRGSLLCFQQKHLKYKISCKQTSTNNLEGAQSHAILFYVCTNYLNYRYACCFNLDSILSYIHKMLLFSIKCQNILFIWLIHGMQMKTIAIATAICTFIYVDLIHSIISFLVSSLRNLSFSIQARELSA